MPKPLSGRVALVTGGANGLGRSHALLLAARGADVIIQDIDEDAAHDTASAVRELGGMAHVAILDLRDVDRIETVIRDIERQAGAVDILVNNAGIAGNGLTIEQVDRALFDDTFNIHVRGTFFVTQSVVPGMKARRNGRIINTSSNLAMGGHTTMSHYAGAKSAILGLTKSWAREFAPFNITVNAVAPGLVKTNMTLASRGHAGLESAAKESPLGRLAEPLEISYAVAWLASDEAAMMTGQVVAPNGGTAIVGI